MLVFKCFVLLAPYVCFHILVKVTEWPPIGKIAAHSAYDMFSWYKYLIIHLVFSHLGFWSGNLFLIAPFPDLCLLVPFLSIIKNVYWKVKTPVDLKQRVYEPSGTYSPRPGTGASHQASPRATTHISRNVCAQSKWGSTGDYTG